ncbi:hypothetical protein [Halovivax gelatinilyticus]|uniref:hypothetical protein n=1 Tax=Halovivax gelatinilyticus TaxID=2961597 RepID=UPI0020CA94B4|nr:hypothetical protein [Halovivax gelatinilyticus]
MSADLIELRNAIVDTGYEERTRDVSVSLGTQYESRTMAINPPDPRGTLRSNSTGDPHVRVQSADGSEYSFATSFLEYEPGYNEYADAPVTVLEHGLVYAEHGYANVTRDRGGVISENRIVIPLVEGDLNVQGSESVSVTIETFDVYHVSDAVEEIRLPTNAFEAWNQSYDGLEFDEDYVVLDEDAIDDKSVYVAQIGVGDDRSQNQTTSGELESFGEPVSDSGDDGGSSGPYDVRWSVDQQHPAVTDCDERGCSEDYHVPTGSDDVTFDAESDASGASADFSYRDNDGVGVSIVAEEGFDQDGDGQVTLDNFNSEGTVDLYVYSGGTSDVITVSVTDDDEPYGSVNFPGAVYEDDEYVNVTVDFGNTDDDTAYLVVENERTGVTESMNVTSIGPQTIDVESVDGIEVNDTISAALYSSQDQEVVLDSASTSVGHQPMFEIVHVEYDDPVTDGESVQFEVEITNNGEQGTHTISLAELSSTEGWGETFTDVDSTNETIESGSTSFVHLEWSAVNNHGGGNNDELYNIEITIDEVDEVWEGEITVQP